LKPLREHKEDIPALLGHFIAHYNRKFRKSIQGPTREAEELLLRYDWPGNIRELKNAIERVMILADGNRITAKNLRSAFPRGAKSRRRQTTEMSEGSLPSPPEAYPYTAWSET
jgi:DNA-binding NtrC family response regulator